MAEIRSLSVCIEAVLQRDPTFLEHKVEKSVKTSTHTSQASEVLAENVEMEHLDILERLRRRYTHTIGSLVLDFVPVTAQGQLYFNSATLIFQDTEGLNINEVNESHINSAHQARLQIVLRTTRSIVYELAARNKEEGAEINLEEVKRMLKKLEIRMKGRLTNGIFSVFPDEGLTLRSDEASIEELCLMTLEDKTSKGLGQVIDFDGVQEGDVPNSTTLHAMKQVYTQVALSNGSLGLMTGLRNGTWVYGHNEEPRSGNHKRILYATKNLTMEGLGDAERLKVLLEAEILCFFWRLPLLLKTGQELGQGAHGAVKTIRGMNLVVKIGSADVIRHEASFYLRARPHRNLPMVADFGAFDIDGSNGCALVLELARPVDDASVDPYEISKAVDDLNTRLRIHHHDISLANMVRGIADGKLKIIDFAEAVDAEDCDKNCDRDYIKVGA
ncbi:hypothetical protein PC9H_008916 [Pleurotus ostreatus]|uniref:Protein kinase domain-containing protein n=3 Tax=Pleurotus ostreatus TaxID=5322 RepID=A0A8H6ZS20_PLEOS|nr:uncharacterized protein PC9H_008916 [Pleurotus ostreatus]KAF7426547.1 hypothetical protein PC9H_008916 [Pleurotus ostreatus]